MRDAVAAARFSELLDWNQLWGALALFVAAAAIVALVGRGRPGPGAPSLGRAVGAGLERLTGVPGWAAAMGATATFGMAVAGNGMYRDFAWHIALGRDRNLWTAPHTGILVGIAVISAASVAGAWVADASGADVGVRVFGLPWPRSCVLLGAFGASAIVGFPLDAMWHDRFGIDITIWSPSHMLLVVGVLLTPLASWLALGEAGVRAGRGRASTVVHVLLGLLVLLGLTGAQAEPALGLPQFQQLYHPVLYAVAAGFALPAMVVAAGRWWAPLVVAGIGGILAAGELSEGTSSVRAGSSYLVAALGVALVARAAGTHRRFRFAAWSGLVVGTAGLAGEWWWSQGSRQPWGPGLLPEGPLLAGVVAIAAATLGAAFGATVRGEGTGIRGRVLLIAGVVAAVGLTLPLPRLGADVGATIDVERAGDRVSVRARLDPPDAADDARWFQLVAWQGGGLETVRMVAGGEDGTFRSDGDVPVGGEWKTVLRLHRGAAMVAVPIWLPLDPEIGRPEVAVGDKVARFEPEHRYLLREQHDGPLWFALAVYALLAVVFGTWIALVVWVARGIGAPDLTDTRRLARV